MSRLRWAKFFWDDWASDNALSLCTLAAQGLWMRLLCIAAQGDDYGSITIGGVTPPPEDLARLIRPAIDPRRFKKLLAELESKKVIRRDPDGTLFSRRMRVELESFLSQSRKGNKSAEVNGDSNLRGARSQPDAASVTDQKQPPHQAEERTPPSPRKRGASGGGDVVFFGGGRAARNGFVGAATDDMMEDRDGPRGVQAETGSPHPRAPEGHQGQTDREIKVYATGR